MGTPIPGGKEGNMSAGHQAATALNFFPSLSTDKPLYKGPRKGRRWLSQRGRPVLTEWPLALERLVLESWLQLTNHMTLGIPSQSCQWSKENIYTRGVKLVFTGGHMSLTVAFKGLNVILRLYKCNYSLSRGKELGTAARQKQGAGPDKTRWKARFGSRALCLPSVIYSV